MRTLHDTRNLMSNMRGLFGSLRSAPRGCARKCRGHTVFEFLAYVGFVDSKASMTTAVARDTTVRSVCTKSVFGDIVDTK